MLVGVIYVGLSGVLLYADVCCHLFNHAICGIYMCEGVSQVVLYLCWIVYDAGYVLNNN
jgi:hypothetical protein